MSGKRGNGLRVTMISPEVDPFSKTGGLGDVARSLPQALAKAGAQVCIITPLYRQTDPGDTRVLGQAPFIIGGRERRVEFLEGRLPSSDARVIFINSPEDFDRAGIYGDNSGDYADNALRFGLFCQAAILAAHRWSDPQILHLHDWTTGLIPVYLRHGERWGGVMNGVKIVFTIHNLGYQGKFHPSVMEPLGLDENLFHWKKLEFWGKMSFLKGGILYSDSITTVSPTYAEEICTPPFGHGMDGILSDRKAVLSGILNGVDYLDWDPESDDHLKSNFGIHRMTGKNSNKRELRRIFGLESPKATPLIAMITRLTEQKGIDLALQAIPEIIKANAQVVILGKGDARFEEAALAAAQQFPGKCGAIIDFDIPLSHKIIAGADILLVPSRYEPCGLTQLYGLKYGTIPVARAVGGLKDTLVDFDASPKKGNAFLFDEADPKALMGALSRAFSAFHSKKKIEKRATWSYLRHECMKQDWSWDKSAFEYKSLFQRLSDSSAGEGGNPEKEETLSQASVNE